MVALAKGGVGKTTSSQHLAHALALMGRAVLLIDVDKQASLTRRYDLSHAKGTMADVLGMDLNTPPTHELGSVRSHHGCHEMHEMKGSLWNLERLTICGM